MSALTTPSSDSPAQVPAARLAEGAVEPVDRLNSLLCDEIAAETAYRLSADRIKVGSDEALYLGLLRQFQEEHGLAAEAIQEQIREIGAEATDVSGSLGVWGEATRCTGSVFGNRRSEGGQPSTLECLRRGECHNLDNYQSHAGGLDPSSAQLLKNLLIPTQRRHVHVLDELLGTGAEG